MAILFFPLKTQKKLVVDCLALKNLMPKCRADEKQQYTHFSRQVDLL